MRLLLLSLLALGAHAASIGYRNNLLAYAPARGEFPVQSELAQGYMRYLDATGAERLIAFNYPEPLYGIRSEQPNALLTRSSSSNNQQQQQQQHLELFRAWCEQRYNALRLELERLRAEGKQPTANMLAQYEPLEQLIKTNAFEAVPGLSPEVQRARDEHLRIWNEARLQVIQAEATAPQQTQVKQIFSTAEPKPIAALLDTSKPVQETAEVLRARDEHLRIYNEALQQQQQQQSQPQDQPQIPAQLFKSTPEQQQAPQPVQETDEVKRAREEHLRIYNEALQQQPQSAQAQPIEQPTQPEIPEQFIRTVEQPQNQAQPQFIKAIPYQPQEQALNQAQPQIQSQFIKAIPYQPQPEIQGQTQLFKTAPYQPLDSQQAPQPVQETDEVKRARENHLKLYNEALQQQTQPAQAQDQPIENQQPQIKNIPYQPQESQQSPQPVEETPEVKRAREEHLKQYNEIVLRQAAEPKPQPQPSYAPLPTPAAQTTTGEQATISTKSSIQGPLQSIKAHELQIQLLSQAKLTAEDKVADIADRIRLQERDRDAQLALEQERLEEVRQAELEQQREEQRLQEEQRQLDLDRIALREQEQRRLENERLEESMRLQTEQKELQQLQQLQLRIDQTPAEQPSASSYKFIAQAQQQQPQQQQLQPQPQAIAQQQQQVQNGFFLRIQAGQPSQQSQPAAEAEAGYLLAQHTQNPFLLRYIQQPQALLKTAAQLPSSTTSTTGITSTTSSTSSTKTSAGLSELELATREHFRAHEIALEQLRLANLKNPNPNLIPCTH